MGNIFVKEGNKEKEGNLPLFITLEMPDLKC
jgi:hypothetical protein